jgi:hypothetical protein
VCAIASDIRGQKARLVTSIGVPIAVAVVLVALVGLAVASCLWIRKRRRRHHEMTLGHYSNPDEESMEPDAVELTVKKVLAIDDSGEVKAPNIRNKNRACSTDVEVESESASVSPEESLVAKSSVDSDEYENDGK